MGHSNVGPPIIGNIWYTDDCEKSFVPYMNFNTEIKKIKVLMNLFSSVQEYIEV